MLYGNGKRRANMPHPVSVVVKYPGKARGAANSYARYGTAKRCTTIALHTCISAL